MSYEDLCSGKHCSICKAYATFVAQGASGSKVSSSWQLQGLGWPLAFSGESWAGPGFRHGTCCQSSQIPYPMYVGCTVGCRALGRILGMGDICLLLLLSPPLCLEKVGTYLPAVPVGWLPGITAHPCSETPPRGSLSGCRSLLPSGPSTSSYNITQEERGWL